MKKLLLILCFITACFAGKAQTTLVAGDIAFTGYTSVNAGTSAGQLFDEFSFVLLKNITSGTAINFTDNGWLGSPAALTTGEGIIAWTCSGALTAGTEVYITGAVARINGVQNGTVSNVSNTGVSGLGLSSAGDQVLAFQGASTSPTFISGIHMNVESSPASTPAGWDNASVAGTAKSNLPPGLTTDVNAIWFRTEVDNSKFNCTGVPTGTVANARAAVCNVANWIVNNNPSGSIGFTLPSGCTFIAVACSSQPTANAGGSYSSCGNVQLSGSVGGSANAGTWSSASGGTFTPSTTTLNAVYHPSATDLSNGSATLVLTSNNPNGAPCLAATNNASVTFTAISDGNVCTTDACPATGGIASHTAVNTDDNNVCTTDGCDPVTGVFHTPVNTNDNNVCTTDACDPITGPSHTAISVDDNNVCTTDGCDPVTGIFHTPVNTNDNNVCTTDGCDPVTGVFHNSVNTNDNNVCTTDACDPATGAITHTAANTNDNNVCTTDGCDPITGVFHTPLPIVNDNNVCTTDGCDPVTGSTHTTLPIENDNNVCTTDGCDHLTGPTHTPVNTNDNNVCTADGCDPITGIFHTPISVDDNNVCTTDACDPITGPSHTAISVDDNNACTTDACDPITGPSHTAVNTNDNNACTTDGCDPSTGAITHTAVNTNDNDACTTDACDPSTGAITHTAVNTNDNNVCTTDGCDPVTGIFHTPVNTDDGNVCTNDGCDPVTGVFHTPVAEICGNNIDDDCDGLIDEGCGCANPPTAYAGNDQSVCSGSNVNITAVIGGSATTGTWTSSGTGSFSPDANATNGSNSSYIPSAADYTAGSVTLTLCTDAGAINCTPACDAMTVTFNSAPASPSAITGAGALCNPTSGATFCTTPVAGATSYTWTVPPGTTIVSGQGTLCIVVAFSTINIHNGVSGSVCVTANNSNGCGSSAPTCTSLSVQAVAPVQPNSISGPAKACPGDVFVYSISPVSRAASYNWVAPAGATVTAGQGTTTATIAYGVGFTASGSVSVSAVNGCGSSAARLRSVSPNNALAPVAITGPASGVCGMNSVSYCISAPVAAATSYIWSIVGAGATINGSNTGTCVMVDFTSLTSVTLSVSAVNGCGTGSARSLVITGRPGTPGTITGPTSVCANGTYPYSVATVTGASAYTWTVPSGAVVLTGQGTKNVTIKYGPVPASSISISVKTSNACGTSASRFLNAITIAACPRVVDAASATSISAYPNPVKDLLNVNFTGTQEMEYTVKMTDMTGRVVFADVQTSTEGENHVELNVKGLSSGVYMLNFQMGDTNEQIRIFVD